MTDRETINKAKALFIGATQGDLLAREVIAIAERAIQKAALWEELADQRALEIAALSAQQDAQWEQAQAEADSASPYSYAVAGGPVKADQAQKELADLRAQRDELWEMLTPLKDAVLFARAQRRPMGIGQDFSQGPASVRIELGTDYGREKDNAGFWIYSDDVADSDSPNPCHRIALALIRLAYAVAGATTARGKPVQAPGDQTTASVPTAGEHDGE